jgi:hypothetical protein
MEEAAILFRQNLINAVEYSTPRLIITPKSKSWWNQEISDQRLAMQQAKRVWKSNKDNNNWLLFKNKRNSYFRAIRKLKEKC